MTGDDVKVLLPAWKTPEITAWALHRADSRGAARIRVVLDALAESGPALG